jgi:hypothetical protein
MRKRVADMTAEELERVGDSTSSSFFIRSSWINERLVALLQLPFQRGENHGAVGGVDLGAGTVHLHVRVDGQVRHGLWRAYRHPRRSGCHRQHAAAEVQN